MTGMIIVADLVFFDAKTMRSRISACWRSAEK